MVADLLTRIAGFGFAVQASLAPTPGAAWALARFAGATAVVDEKDLRKQMGGLPVAALRLGTETVASLNRLGLRRVGDLYALPRASFAARYGEEAGLRLDQALGRIAEPISPRRHVAPFRSRLAFAEPIGHAEDIARGLDRLLTDLSQQLSRSARGGRRLELALFRVDGSVQQIEIGTARATRDPQHLARLFAERLTTLDAGFGVETMTLHAPATDKLAPDQSVFAGDAGKAVEPMSALMDRLSNRLGFGRLQRLQPAASHLPERAQRFLPTASERPDVDAKAWSDGKMLHDRPICLLSDPEPMVAMTPERTARHLRFSDGATGFINCAGWMDRSGFHRNGGDRTETGPAVLATIGGSKIWMGGDFGFIAKKTGARKPGLRKRDGSYKGFSPDMTQYAELQVTSNFSFLRGASHPEEMALQAAAFGYAAIGIADRNSLAGVVRAHIAAREAGLRLCVGARLDLFDGISLLAYPTDRAAYGRMSRLITLGRRRAPKGECEIHFADVLEWGAGMTFLAVPPSTVIPAKAGIRKILGAIWIPAFAGMTIRGSLHNCPH